MPDVVLSALISRISDFNQGLEMLAFCLPVSREKKLLMWLIECSCADLPNLVYVNLQVTSRDSWFEVTGHSSDFCSISVTFFALNKTLFPPPHNSGFYFCCS